MKLCYAVSFAAVLAATACGKSSTSQVASHKHHAPKVVNEFVADAAALAGNYTENAAAREEWNQSAPFTGTMSLVLVPGTTGGSYTNVADNGEKTTGTWSCTENGGLSFDDIVFAYTLTGKTLTIDGGHDESKTVFVRN